MSMFKQEKENIINLKKQYGEFEIQYTERKIVYIVGPYAGQPEENTKFAEQLGNFAQSLGYAPVVPHSSIHNGVYGSDDIPEERKEGMDSTLSILQMAANSDNSILWVIQNDDKTLSSGTALEFNLWCRLTKNEIIVKTKSDWEELINKVYIHG